jgi:plasmid stability protein
MAVDPSVRVDLAVEYKGKKAFDQADKATQKLTNNVKKLAGAFGLAFSTRAVVNFSKQAVKAFAEDDAAITALRQNLKNLGLAYQSQNAENFIATLEAQTNILDDELRPAYAKLSKVTLSTTKTQELMALAVDVARANGLEFSAVINTLSRAYVGNYKGLKQLNTGLTDAELATKDFAEIQAILIKQSTGANKAYIDTFAGSIDKLAVASANAKEVIGEGLVDLFADMAGNGDIDVATANVNKFATAVSDLLKDVSEYNLADFVSAFVTGNITEGTAQKLVKRPSARRFFTGGSGVDSDLLAARAAAAAAAAKIKADKLAAANKIKADKLAAANKAKLDKAAAVFEIQKIQIAAALKGKISEEEKVRLLLMQAIEDENADKAEALAKKLEEIQAKNAKIAADLLKIGETKDPFATWAGSLSLALIELGKFGKGIADVTGLVPGVNFNPNQNKDRNYDMKVAAVEAAVALSTIEKDPALTSSIFSEDDTITDILSKIENIAADAAEAAEAAAASVVETQITVDALAAATTNGTAVSGMNFNPYQNRDRNYDSGYGSTPSITINIEGNVLDGDDFTEKVNDALLNANRQGLPRTAAGFLVDAG